MGRASRPKPKRLGRKLLEIRTRLDLSQAQMVKRLDDKERWKLYAGHISEYESGTREPPLPVLLRYARIAGVPMEALVDDEINLPKRLPAEVKLEWVMVRREIS